MIALRNEIVEQWGTVAQPLRHSGRLDSAITRPRTTADEHAALVRQGGLLASGVSQARSLLDGTKHRAYLAPVVFLRSNGIRVTSGALDLARQLELVAESTSDRAAAVDRFEAWLRANIAQHQT